MSQDYFLSNISNKLSSESTQASSINTTGSTVGSDSISTIATASIPQITLDRFRESDLFSGIDGSGYSIVVLDTGIDLDHPVFNPDFDGNGTVDRHRIVYSDDFSDGDGAGKGDVDASDTHDHGSHVSSIAAAMAPGANIIHLKVFPDGTNPTVDDAFIQQALRWTVDHAAEYNIASVNLSIWNASAQYQTEQPESSISKEYERLAKVGVIPVAITGNGFAAFQAEGTSIYAAYPNVIGVGAVDSSNKIASISQRHETLADIFAPGVGIVGADRNGGTRQMNGTSMAAPHIAGITALAQQLAVKEIGRRLTPQEFRDLLRTTGVTIYDEEDPKDGVKNTEKYYQRVDVFGLGEGILTAKLGAFPTTGDDKILGNAGNNYIAGFGGNDSLYGNQGDDTLMGGIGDDYLDGGDGEDSLSGGDGNDRLIGNWGNDILSGNAGNDLLEGNYGQDYIYGDDGEDTLYGGGDSDDLSGGAGNDLLYGFDASSVDYDDQYYGDRLYGNEGDDTLFGGNGADSLEGDEGNDNLNGGNDDDSLWGNDGDDILIGETGNDGLWGGDGNDEIVGGDGNDGLAGEDGNDTLRGGLGDDRLYGDKGNDSLYSSEGNDLLDGGTGTDSMFGSFGDDTYYIDDVNDTVAEYIDEGFDTIYASVSYTLPDYVERLILTGNNAIDVTGNDSDNSLTGNDASNVLDGKGGNDLLDGKAGNDRLIGGTGDDILIGGLGADLLEGGDGIDIASYAAATAGVTVNLVAGRGAGGEATGDTLQSIENLEGSEYRDNLVGADQANLLGGLGGNDFLDGRNGNDTLDGEAGSDRLLGGDGDDQLLGQAGDDDLDGGNGNDSLYGGDGDDFLEGQAGNDLLDGGAGDDTFLGGDDNDTLLGGAGNDILYGESGNDRLNGGLGEDFLYGAEGDDQLLGADGNDYLEGSTGNDQLLGGVGDDLLDAGVGNDTLDGGEGKDELLGGIGNDVLKGGMGNDLLTGGGGIDRFVIHLGDGLDTITDFAGIGRGSIPTSEATTEADVIEFDGADLIAKNMLLTQNGSDLEITFAGVSDTQVILKNFSLENLDNLGNGSGSSAGLGNIQFLFEGQNQIQDNFDVFNAEWQNGNPDWNYGRVLNLNTVTFLNDLDNAIQGFDNSDDVINGQGGNDSLWGLGGNDVLRGGAGNDTLIGGAGMNYLTGNAGSDTFVISTEGINTVTDFTVGQDFIGLSDGLTVDQLKIEQGIGVNSSSTWVKLASNDSLLMSLNGVGATDLTTNVFLPSSSYQPPVFA
ncbi:MAG: S8 family serine peptidase [Leptolyngbyaceae cyanobacterium bins.302]|nr:S8 family serine peptidase [Leptolyngbyaceae cyanobacterium bins.302]